MCVCTEQRDIEGKGRGEERSRRKGISMTDSPRSGCRSAAHFISARRHTKQHSTAPILLEYRLLSSFFWTSKPQRFWLCYLYTSFSNSSSCSRFQPSGTPPSMALAWCLIPISLQRFADNATFCCIQNYIRVLFCYRLSSRWNREGL